MGCSAARQTIGIVGSKPATASVAVKEAVAPPAGAAAATDKVKPPATTPMASVRSTRSRAYSEADSDADGIVYVSRKSTRNITLQAAGHTGNVLRIDGDPVGGDPSAQPVTILKKLDRDEAEAYERLYDCDDDPIHKFVARFFGEVNMDPRDDEPGQAPECYIRLSNLLRGFNGPYVMDCKIGVRSFMETECESAKPRHDLFERMQKISPDEATSEEKAAGFITKHRWMSFRDKLSSTASLGFRVDGIAGPDVDKLQQNDFASTCKRHQVVRELLDYLPPPRWRTAAERKLEAAQSAEEAPEALPEVKRLSGETAEVLNCKLSLAISFRDHLVALQAACDASPFFRSHEFVGTSLLLAVEASPPKAEVFLIDFAKARLVPEGLVVDHKSPWKVGNHEDGVLFGLENCMSCWDEVVQLLRAELSELEKQTADA